ncbi:MAG TPA: molybdopterin-binding protein [Anaeromyxobacteraceae bacterium]|nr:molybdopterin-binding protein [Anaeromyxobacteraceae bacterium]
MAAGERPTPGGGPDDVRLRGFADRASLDQAQAWVDARSARLGAVEVGVADSVGRIPAAPPAVVRDHPPADRAGEDGYAVRSGETIGATSYSPASFRLQDAAAPLAPGAAALVAAGAPLPAGADALAGFDAAQASGRTLEVIGSVAEGAGIERAGQQLRAGTPLGAMLGPIRPHQAGLLASLGVTRVSVVAHPRVRLLVAGPKPAPGAPGEGDAHRPMLHALVERDGGIVEAAEVRSDLRGALRRAAASGADLVILSGRTGAGPDDEAPLALAEVGALAFHGVALRPGGSAAMGLAGEVPVALLPGDPLACLCAYELLAGRLVRRLGGRDPGLPHPTREAEVGRKIVSAVGLVEACQVRLAAGRVEPLGAPEFGGLAVAARADGFVVVPEALEGYPPGARVTVHLY